VSACEYKTYSRVVETLVLYML